MRVHKAKGPRPSPDLGVAKAVGLQSTFMSLPAPRVTKQEQELLSAGSSAQESEDLYPNIMYQPGQNNTIIPTPYDMHALSHLNQLNNALNQCITAYEVNIDGTGFVIEQDLDEDTRPLEVTDDQKAVWEFFKEPWPEKSFVTVRRELRRDLEITGNGYLEVIRSVNGEIVYVRRLDPKWIRLVQLDMPVPVTKTVRRFGEDVEITMLMRERRYAQAHSTKMHFKVSEQQGTDQRRAQMDGSDARTNHDHIIFFKEFGASRDVNKWSGDWAPLNTLPADLKGTELIHFTVELDVHTQYGLPRWINQTPSVLGSRKAEELNLTYFNSGGVPPLMVIIEGGELTQRVRENIEQYMWNPNADKHVAAIVEAHQSGGSLDGTNNVRVKVERFGSERQKDSLFESYDEKSEKRIRSSFRLAPIFVGRTDDYSFATAFASYVVGEVQVFKPERREFDERINKTIIKEFNQKLDADPPVRMRSLPLSTVDVQTQIRALNVAKDVSDPDSFIRNVNEKADLTLKAQGGADPDISGNNNSANEDGSATQNVRGPNNPDSLPEGDTPNPQPRSGARGSTQRAQKIDPMELVQLSKEWVQYLTDGMEKEDSQLLTERIKHLDDHDRSVFDAYVVNGLLPNKIESNDSVGLLAVAGDLMAQTDGST